MGSSLVLLRSRGHRGFYDNLNYPARDSEILLIPGPRLGPSGRRQVLITEEGNLSFQFSGARFAKVKLLLLLRLLWPRGMSISCEFDLIVLFANPDSVD